MTTQDYQIGDWVRVTGKAISRYRYKDGRSYRVTDKTVGRVECEPFVGRVVGKTRRYEGRVDPDWEAGGRFTPTGSKLVWLVRRGLMNKPIDVLPEDIAPADEHPERLPTKYQDNPWAEANSKIMRELMEHWPRDEKGRFLPADKCEHVETNGLGYCGTCGRRVKDATDNDTNNQQGAA